MMAVLGKSTGTGKGKGGTMHIADINKGMLGVNEIVGSNIPVATGVTLITKVKATDNVSVIFFDDGASSQGGVHVTLPTA
ncbi:MAG: pyruvate dehydrogenase E1 component alpha subunit [Chloroflexi bacterium]|jgi:pyruvate dehydrogenase E1 component alpha subunit|nr:MAG: pyruvate dehydrogenase E1 component alpha subunit [Chloroflexota bacterium]